MGSSDTGVVRPDFGVYNPEIRGRPLFSKIIALVAITFAVGLTLYVVLSFIAILSLRPIGTLLNLIMFPFEVLLAIYSIYILTIFSRSFLPVKTERQPKIILDEEDKSKFPTISVLIAAYKEPLTILRQTILAACDLKYASSRIEVAVMEDGRQGAEIEQFCKNNGVMYFTRPERKDFKAGAINYALPKLSGDYVLFLDADHIAEPNIIVNCLLAWRKGTIGVQTRIDFTNMVTFLTRVSAFLQLQFFSLFQRGRRASGSAIFAGGGALFDRNKLLQEGGMDPTTIADDTDTSIKLRAKGHRIEYIDTVGAWALVPWDPLSLIRQIWRWQTGLTRSLRARWKTIATSKNSNLLIKYDHLATLSFPTLAIISWLLAFNIILMIILDVKITRVDAASDYTFLPGIATALSLLPIILGVSAFLFDDSRIIYRRSSFVSSATSILGFYFLAIAAQPLLISSVTKGLFARPVVFIRTPKEKKTSDEGIYSVKKRFLFYAILIFILGIIFGIFSLSLSPGDPRQVTLILGAYAGMLPFIIGLAWYWRLEDYMLRVGDLSALEFLENLASEHNN